ncbi:MAG: hypothetical protein CME62_15815 [Halobacteriovoraceae bacterium]|nr:hypothetical protein [Halobacteriovoraceae bacterium]|tara:strand:- start:14762 stop:15628 length:867 start_codon:yes stop_codon:yes gene_type:complete
MEKFVLIFLFLGISHTHASEVDSFSKRHENLNNALIPLNKITNEWLKQAAKRTQNCSQENLHKAIKRKFNRFGWSKFERMVNKAKFIPKQKAPKDHVYSYFPGFGKPMTIIHFPQVMSPLLNMSGHWIGSDKFSHFFNEGYNYYQKVMGPEGSINKALAYGKWMEQTYWGLKTTGIYSYADLSANFQGFLFFKNLTQGLKPYFACKDRKWQQIRNFDWSRYIDASWDESVNCNDFRNEELSNHFRKRLSELENNLQTNLSCPLKSEICFDLREKYGDFASHILSPQCY